MASRWFTQFFGTLHKKPVMLDCTFDPDPTAPDGTGVRNFKGAGIASVFMHSTATFTGNTTTATNTITNIVSTSTLKPGMPISAAVLPAGTTIRSILSPTSIQVSANATATIVAQVFGFLAIGNTNPIAGYMQVNFQDFYNFYYYGGSQILSPPSGVPILLTAGGLVVGTPYMITTVGTSTPANFQLLGLPKGIKPATGVTFFATSAAVSLGTGAVMALDVPSGIASVEVVGDPEATLGKNFTGNSTLGGASGAYVLLKAVDAAGALSVIAPGTGIALAFFLSNSSLLVNGS